MVSISCKQFCAWASSWQPFLLRVLFVAGFFCSGRAEHSEAGPFQGLAETIRLLLFTYLLKALARLQAWNVLILEEIDR